MLELLRRFAGFSTEKSIEISLFLIGLCDLKASNTLLLRKFAGFSNNCEEALRVVGLKNMSKEE